MQLIASTLSPAVPRWSPDGTRIAFSGGPSDQPYYKIYVVSANGGKPELVSAGQNDQLDATWMPDGNSLVFAGPAQSASRVRSLDLRTGQVSVIPGSDGLFSPRVSPDVRFIVAGDVSANSKVLLFDRTTQKWSELMTAKDARTGWYQWSADSKSIYVTEVGNVRMPVVYRVPLSDRKVEHVATFIVPEGITGAWGTWAGVAPDGSPLTLRDLSMSEIYTLDVDLP